MPNTFAGSSFPRPLPSGLPMFSSVLSLHCITVKFHPILIDFSHFHRLSERFFTFRAAILLARPLIVTLTDTLAEFVIHPMPLPRIQLPAAICAPMILSPLFKQLFSYCLKILLRVRPSPFVLSTHRALPLTVNQKQAQKANSKKSACHHSQDEHNYVMHCYGQSPF